MRLGGEAFIFLQRLRRVANDASMSFVTSPDETAAKAAVENAEAFLAMCQADQDESKRALFPNHTRAHSLEQRYRGKDRRARLRSLKSLWDPEGVFTKHFL